MVIFMTAFCVCELCWQLIQWIMHMVAINEGSVRTRGKVNVGMVIYKQSSNKHYTGSTKLLKIWNFSETVRGHSILIVQSLWFRLSPSTLRSMNQCISYVHTCWQCGAVDHSSLGLYSAVKHFIPRSIVTIPSVGVCWVDNGYLDRRDVWHTLTTFFNNFERITNINYSSVPMKVRSFDEGDCSLCRNRKLRRGLSVSNVYICST